MMKSYGITLIVSAVLSAMFMFVLSDSRMIPALINAVSMTSLTLLIIGGFLYVVEGGFFHGIVYSFNRFFKKTFKTGQLLEEIEEDDDYRPKTHSFALVSPFLVVGATLFLLTLLVSLLQ